MDGNILTGGLPRKQCRMVSSWLVTREDEAHAARGDAVRGAAFMRIERSRASRGSGRTIYEADGIVYAGEPREGMPVTGVRDTGDYITLVTFSAGETRLVDRTEPFGLPAFACLEDKTAFGTLEVGHGALTWLDDKVDIAPEGLYARSYEYPVPA